VGTLFPHSMGGGDIFRKDLGKRKKGKPGFFSVAAEREREGLSAGSGGSRNIYFTFPYGGKRLQLAHGAKGGGPLQETAILERK